MPDANNVYQSSNGCAAGTTIQLQNSALAIIFFVWGQGFYFGDGCALQRNARIAWRAVIHCCRGRAGKKMR
ncbi:MAG: hypothetical protein ABIO19_12335, partial [Burkholderiaceae bacterium]